MDWDRNKVKECLEILAQMPDFDNLLFPETWGKEYDIPITPAKSFDLNQYLKQHKKVINTSDVQSFEVRGPLPGGVREVIGEEPYVPEVITKTLTDTDEETLPELQEVHPAKAEILQEQQESQALGPTGSSQPTDAVGHNGHDGQGL